MFKTRPGRCDMVIINSPLSPRVVYNSSELDLWSWAYVLEVKVTHFMA